MVYRLKVILLWMLGLGLPWHGALTVFGPDFMRWWKEVLLTLLVCLILPQLLKIKPYSDFKNVLGAPWLWAAGFLLWGLFLVFVNKDLHTSVMAYRYLGLGFFAMLLGYGLWKNTLFSGKNGYVKSVDLFHIFCTALTLGVLASTLFGVWAKLLGGYAVLGNWYSQTISSWVPGQTIPLYHQVGDFIRMQGASSGPVEYSHLGVLALWYVLYFPRSIFFFKNTTYILGEKIALMMLLFFGVLQSGSRAALLGIVILGLIWAGQRWMLPTLKRVNWTLDKAAALLLVMIVLTGMLKFTFSKSVIGNLEIMNKNIVRTSDPGHLSRPLEAWSMAIKSPLFGNLGTLGPAARTKNLKETNNDQAPIAESVPFDIAAQLGLLGLGLWLLFYVAYFRQASTEIRALLLAFTPLMLLATIFDMTPVSISFYLILGMGLVLPQLKMAGKKDHAVVFGLKKITFKTYVEQVWGWQEKQQQGFVLKELELGGVQLVCLEGEVLATFSVVEERQTTKLYSFYVHPAYQSQGIGSYLLCFGPPAKALHLQVLKVNSRAKAFYQSHGFEVVGEDANHWNLERLS